MSSVPLEQNSFAHFQVCTMGSSLPIPEHEFCKFIDYLSHFVFGLVGCFDFMSEVTFSDWLN
jgi:hypothetical protein